MQYKVLIKLIVPEIEEVYEMYIPINKTIGEISFLLTKFLNDFTNNYPIKYNSQLCNKNTGIIYNKDVILKNTDIRNGTELILF